MIAFDCLFLVFCHLTLLEASEASEQSEWAKLSGAARAGAQINFWASEFHAWTCKYFYVILVVFGLFFVILFFFKGLSKGSLCSFASLSSAAGVGAGINFWMSEFHAWTCKHVFVHWHYVCRNILHQTTAFPCFLLLALAWPDLPYWDLSQKWSRFPFLTKTGFFWGSWRLFFSSLFSTLFFHQFFFDFGTVLETNMRPKIDFWIGFWDVFLALSFCSFFLCILMVFSKLNFLKIVILPR